MTMPTPPYDAIKDFTPIALVAKAPLAIAIRQDLPFNDVKGLIAHAKANPGKRDVRDRLAGIGGSFVDGAAQARGRHRLPRRALQGFGPCLSGPRRRSHRRVHRSDPRLCVARQSRQAEGHRRHLEGTAAGIAERAHRRGDAFRASSSTAGTGSGARRSLPKEIAERLNAEVNKALVRRHARRSSPNKDCCSRRARSTISSSSSRKTWRRSPRSSKRRISVPSERDSASASRHRLELRHRQGDRAGAARRSLATWSGSMSRRRRSSTIRSQPVRVDLTRCVRDRISGGARRDPCGRSFTPQAYCA